MLTGRNKEAGYSYIILGAGKQGVAAAYDVLRFGFPARVTLADTSLKCAREAVLKLKRIAASALQKNKPILGLTIIKNMVCGAEFCAKGTILDPRNGDLYHATMKLVNQGQQLKVRGYLGISLFGKTVVWNRVSEKVTQ